MFRAEEHRPKNLLSLAFGNAGDGGFIGNFDFFGAKDLYAIVPAEFGVMVRQRSIWRTSPVGGLTDSGKRA